LFVTADFLYLIINTDHLQTGGDMKKFLIFLFCFTPFIGFAISNQRLNGQKEVTVNVVPPFVVMTCDLAKPGNWVDGGIFADANHSGTFDLADRNRV
jgi:hypothetical protein